jgi:hypothetical protein
MAISTVQRFAARARQRERDHELDLVEGAIALVAQGGAERVALLLRQAARILPVAQRSARPRGVTVRLAQRPDGSELVVEPMVSPGP